MDKDWVAVYTSGSLHNVELLKHILNQADIDAIVLNQQDSFYKSIGDIKLLVRRENVIPAKKIISDAAL
ncbi:MAG TPA: DUF2007 domain-containing protein [Cryomorphaceae bacterium]|nr:DUF2007 domain-containing protein [Cryomorphaceae bacterium]